MVLVFRSHTPICFHRIRRVLVLPPHGSFQRVRTHQFETLMPFFSYAEHHLIFSSIRLPGGGIDRSNIYRGEDSGIMSTLASVPWFLVGLAGIAYEAIASRVEQFGFQFNSRRGYRNLPVDEDAQILRFEDEEE
jgi:hypothetical protein